MLANGVLMGLSPSEVRQLTMAEFDVILKTWNDAHRPAGTARGMDPETEARLTRRMHERKARQHRGG